MYKKKSEVLEFDFLDETRPNNNSKKNRINRSFINKNSKKIKKDPFENFEVQMKQPIKKEEVISGASDNNKYNENYKYHMFIIKNKVTEI